MRILVTRPEEDARDLVAALAARGHEAVVEPMLTIAPAPEAAAPPGLDGVQALLFTSANGVRAFARLSDERALPVLAVGEASAAAARAAGFERVESAGGDVDDLARLAAARLDPAAGALYHGAARRVAGDLKGALEAAGFTVRREVLYEARPATALSEPVRAGLAGGTFGAVAFFSPRTAETFVRLTDGAGLGPACARLAALALSQAVADKARALAWREVRVADRPTQEALLAILDQLDAAPGAAGANADMAQDQTPDTAAGPATDGGPAQALIARFGGIRPMAAKLGVAVSTVQGWRERGAIPAARHREILAAAREHGIRVGPDELAAAAPAPDRGEDRAAEPRAAEPRAAEPAPGAAPRRASAVPESGARPSRPAAPEPDSKPEPEPAPARRPAVNAWLGGFALGALVLALGAGLAVITRDLWAPGPDPAPVDRALAENVAGLAERIAALEGTDGRLAALRDRIAALESEAGAPGPTVDLTPVRDEVAALARRLDGLGARLEGLAGGAAAREALARDLDDLAGRIAALEGAGDRLDALEGRIEALDSRIEAVAAGAAQARATGAADTALALAILQLRDALRGSGPFEAELALVRELAGADDALAAALAPLQPHAAEGVPGLPALEAEFPAAARAILAQGQAGAGEDWVSGVVRRVSGLVTVRPAGPVEGDGAGAVVARAEAHLEGGDLAGAVRELDALDGPAAAAARPWRERAEARLAAARAVTELGRALAAETAAAAGG